MQTGSIQGLGSIAGERVLDEHHVLSLQKQVVHGEGNNSKGSCAVHLQQGCRFDLLILLL